MLNDATVNFDAQLASLIQSNWNEASDNARRITGQDVLVPAYDDIQGTRASN